jgi:hypothetical protein
VVAVARQLALSNGCLSVGCCVGFDQVVLSTVSPEYLHIHTVFNARGLGSWSGSAVQPVLSAAAAGSQVSWLAGGTLSSSLSSRLANRTRQVVLSSSAGLLAVFSSPNSRGTKLACQCAAIQGLPVLALSPCPSYLPTLSGFNWSAVSTTFPSSNLLAFQLVSQNYRLFR